MSLPKHSVPYDLTHPFNFMTFGRSGAQSRAPERPNIKKLKKIR